MFSFRRILAEGGADAESAGALARAAWGFVNDPSPFLGPEDKLVRTVYRDRTVYTRRGIPQPLSFRSTGLAKVSLRRVLAGLDPLPRALPPVFPVRILCRPTFSAATPTPPAAQEAEEVIVLSASGSQVVVGDDDNDDDDDDDNDEEGDGLVPERQLALLDHSFPAGDGSGAYRPSEFQRAVLGNMAILRARAGHKVGVSVMCTAAGKTVVALLDVEREARERPGRGLLTLLFLVHSREIALAAHSKFKRHFAALNLAGYPPSAIANLCEADGLAQLRASPSAIRMAFGLFQGYSNIPAGWLASVTHVIIDEAHHAMAPTYRAVVGEVTGGPRVEYVLGMTATLLHRDDPQGAELKRLFREVVYIDFPWGKAKRMGHFPRVSYLEVLPTLLTASGAPCDEKTYAQVLRDHAGPDGRLHESRVRAFLRALDGSLSRVGMASAKGVKERLTPRFVADCIEQYQGRSAAAGLGFKQSVLVFASGVDDADAIVALINGGPTGLTAEAAHYRCGGAEKEAFQRFIRQEIHILVTVAMVNEGFDVPVCDMVIFARLTASEIIFTQQLGRGLRKDPQDPNKEVVILDLALNLRRRWQLATEEATLHELADQITEFFPVDNFLL